MKIDKNVPIPKRSYKSKYPWKDMEIGDSFAADIEPARLRPTALHQSKKLGWKFTIKADGNGSRCWRVA